MIFFLITLVVFLMMEGVTWLTHKYVMHGFLWYLHKDHHQPNPKAVFQKNDWFFVIFAVPSFLLILFGTRPEYRSLLFIGLGIMFYGMAYFFVHDVLIHQRLSWFRNTKVPYFRGLRKGHKAHHSHTGKEEGEVFGMLYVPKKYFKSLK